MIYIIIPLFLITLILAGIMFYTLEGNKVSKQPSYLQAEPAEEVLERLRHIGQD